MFLHSLFTFRRCLCLCLLTFECCRLHLLEKEKSLQKGIKGAWARGRAVCMTSRSSVLLFHCQLGPNSSSSSRDNKFYWQHRIEQARQAEGAEERDKHSFVIRAMYTYICTWITNWLGATITHFIDSKSMCLHVAHFIRFTVDSRLGHAGVYVMWNSYSSHGSLMLNLCLLPISFTLESAVRE